MLGEEPEQRQPQAVTHPAARTRTVVMNEFSAATHQFQHLARRYMDRALAGDPEALRMMAQAERELTHAAAAHAPGLVARWPWPSSARPTALFTEGAA